MLIALHSSDMTSSAQPTGTAGTVVSQILAFQFPVTNLNVFRSLLHWHNLDFASVVIKN
jgi:hypothetical protein